VRSSARGLVGTGVGWVGGVGAGGLGRTTGRSLGAGDAIGSSGGVDLGRLASDTLRGGGDTGFVGYGLDGTESLGGLLVDDVITSGILVVSREVLVLSLAGLKGTLDVGGGSVVLAADTIVDVLAETGGIGASGVAGLETEGVASHEVVPFDDLGVLVLVSTAGREGVGEEKTTKRVTTLVGAVRVHLTSRVVRFDVDLLLVNQTRDLDIVGGLHELNALESTGGDDTSTTARLCAPSNGLSLGITDNRVRFGSTPQAKVINGVDDGGLTFGLLVFSGRAALVDTELRATFAGSSIGFFREVIPVKMTRSERDAVLGEGNGGDSEDSETASDHN
jgi:hypothetical protein